MKTKTILVVGATGTIGRYITLGLSQQNLNIKALVRDKEKAKSILPPNVELAEGSLQNISDLENALTGVDGLYINLNIGPEEGQSNWHPLTDGIRNLLIVARLCRIKHLQIHSMVSHRAQNNPEHTHWEYTVFNEAIEIVKNSGLDYTIFICSLFFENFHHAFRQGDTLYIPSGSRFPLFWISAYDFGKQVAKAFFHPEALNMEFMVQGSEAITIENAAGVFISKQLAEKLNLAHFGDNPKTIPNHIKPLLKSMATRFESVNEYEEKFQALETWRLFGAPRISFSEFCRGTKPNQAGSFTMPGLYREPLFV